MKKTKVVATVGPSCRGVKNFRRMCSAGLNAVRFNTAHGSIPEYEASLDELKRVADLPVMFDIKGPEIRIQSFSDETLKRNQVFTVGFGRRDSRFFNRDFYNSISVGDTIFLSDGLIKTEVVEKKDRKVNLKVLVGGFLRQNKGVNIPGKHMDFGLFTPWDKKIISYAKKAGADYIALSFTRTAQDVKNLKKKLAGSGIAVISKIENRESILDLPAIVNESDAIMVARGDLGVEFPSEKLPIMQKQIICGCNRAGKTVIVATEMLKSMIWEPRPTRAETSDVANAILDGADAVMLSDETAIGAYPVEAVWEMNRIAREVEPLVKHNLHSYSPSSSPGDSIAHAAHRICERMPVDKIVTLTRSGYTAQLISRYRINKKIIAVTNSSQVKKRLELVWGVEPVLHKLPRFHRIPSAAKHLLSEGLVKRSDFVLFTAGMYTPREHATNVLHLHKIGELVDYVN